MPLPGLRPALTLETEPTARLVDSLTHEVLALTQTEARLLQAWNGVASAVQLSAKVFINGLLSARLRRSCPTSFTPGPASSRSKIACLPCAAISSSRA